jgi:hypothetical protein
MPLRRVVSSTLAAIAAVVVLALMVHQAGSSTSEGAGSDLTGAAPVAVEPTSASSRTGAGPILLRAVDPAVPRADGRLFELSERGTAKRVGAVSCKRVHAIVAGPTLCLSLSDDNIDYDGVVLDTERRERLRFPVDGVPDRARVSPDGRYGAYTSFDPGGSRGYFESEEEFSTYTRIVDLATGTVLLRLEELEVTRAGRPVSLANAELWGVTFADGGRYLATLAVDGEHYLIEGAAGSRRARVVRRRVECPALSPDGTRIAYKRRLGDRNAWRLHVLELSTGRDVPLAERRSIDDQPEWLDDGRVLYSDDRSLFAVPADGGGQPERIARNATSPASLLP